MTEPSASTTESWDTSAQAAPATPAYAQPVVVEQKKESKADMRGVLVTLGGGIEGYTGSTRDLVRPGASYGVSAAIKPSRVFGIELGYSGAVNEFRGEDVAGADIVRNGGHLLGTFGLTASAVQPYLLGGVGISHYNVRGSNSLGLRDDTNGAVPLGAGLRWDVNEDMTLGFEYEYRMTTTDRLDNVSDEYATPDYFDRHLAPEKADLAKRLYDKSYVIDPSIERKPWSNRGNKAVRDGYSTISISFIYKLNNNKIPWWN